VDLKKGEEMNIDELNELEKRVMSGPWEQFTKALNALNLETVNIDPDIAKAISEGSWELS